jgi:uncharacterized protein YfiM (DUF2279 family)
MKKMIACVLATMIFTTATAYGIEDPFTIPDDIHDEDSPLNLRRIRNFNLVAGGGILLWGLLQWDYGSTVFRFRSEGWFEKDTKYGGADKLGHAWASYGMASVYSEVFKRWGLSDTTASRYGALSSFLQTSLIEIGDATSLGHGFSVEDFIMNTAGIALAYVRQSSERVRNSVDFRLEWIPSPALRRGEDLDLTTDYSGHKYILAFKPGGMLESDDFFLNALEIHMGYYTRGYKSADERYFNEKNRYLYAGIGLNVTYLLERYTGTRAYGIFDYIQVPFTYLPYTRRLEQG